MRHKVDNRWIEYRQQIDLLDWPSNMDIALCIYHHKNGSIWTYDTINHLIVDFKTIIALATTTYVVETNLYDLHPMD